MENLITTRTTFVVLRDPFPGVKNFGENTFQNTVFKMFQDEQDKNSTIPLEAYT